MSKVGNVGSTPLNWDKIKELNIKNLRTINDTSISGGTFETHPEDLQALKEAGIKRIIDFRAEASDAYKELCEKEGFEYLQFPINPTSASNRKAHPELTKINDSYVEQLKKYLSMLNKGNAYVGCHYGLDRTNVGVMLNYLATPDAAAPKVLSWNQYDKKNIINNLLNNVRHKYFKKMTPEQIASLGLPEDYNKLFNKKVGELLRVNLH